MEKKTLTAEQVDQVVDIVTGIVIESLKLSPAEANAILEKVQAKLATVAEADLTGDAKPIKILHGAVNLGQIISTLTPSEKDDALFGKVDQFLDQYEENGEKLVAAVLNALFKKLNLPVVLPTEKSEGAE